MKKLFELFMVFFKIGAFTLGGGYAMVPLIQEDICKKKGWIADEDFIDIIAIAQSLPGVLAINTATIVGYKIFGIRGAIVSVLGSALPSFLSILVIAMFFAQFAKYKTTELVFKGIRPAVVALIASAVITFGKKVGYSNFNLIVGIAALILILLNTHPIIVVIVSGLIGIVAEFKGGKKNDTAGN